MAKLCTSVEQSKKLVELGLDTTTADMYWIRHWGKEIPRSIQEGYKGKILSKAWSLAALLGVLPDYTLQTNTDGTVFVVCESKKPMISDTYDNPIDACYEMIIRLNELNLL